MPRSSTRSVLALGVFLLVGLSLFVGAGVAAAADVGRLDGLYRVTLTVTDVDRQGRAPASSSKVGDQLQPQLRFTPTCPSGPCDAKPVDIFFGPTVLTLTADGYQGSGPPSSTAGCGFDVPSTVTLVVTSTADVAGQTVATGFRGTRRSQVGSSCDSSGHVDGRTIVTESMTAIRVPDEGEATPGAVATPSSGGSGAEAGVGAGKVRSGRFGAPSLTGAVGTWQTVSHAPWTIARNALLAVLLALLLPFPAALFNSTLDANYARIRAFLRLPPEDGAAEQAAHAGEERATAEQAAPKAVARTAKFAAMLVAASVLNAFLDPDLGFDRASGLLLMGLVLSTGVVTLVGALPSRAYVRHRYHESQALKLFPLALIFAAACVLISRLTGYQPGYLYGLIAGYAVARELPHDEKGRISLGTSVFMLLVSVLAFVARLPVHHGAVAHGGLLRNLLDTVLAALVAAGISSNVVGLLPLRFLSGEHLYRWNRLVWTGVFAANVFVMLHALAGSNNGTSDAHSVWLAAVLFVAFGTFSVAFWAYFAVTNKKATPVTP